MSNMEININEYLPLRDVVFKNIRDAILSGSLKPNERLMEKELADRLGVSRTPVREALRKLELEGFIEIIPRKGAIVKQVTSKEIKDVLEIRSVLEALAAKSACLKITENEKAQLLKAKEEFENAVRSNNVDLMAQKDVEFHDIIFNATKNERLMQIINNLREQIYRYRITYLYDKKYLENIVKEHVEIYSAIVNKDVDGAEKSSMDHINNQQKAITNSLMM
ncbi:MAG TPA: GntR family transcriptional regulator [Clostridiales bacterium]|nr:GntR family transcriptional regulator [Lachnospiraceae bacterium]HAQ41568.1 GntR family transcriptional regulator [Clostridiales bacterium]